MIGFLGEEPIFRVCNFKALHHPKLLPKYGIYTNIRTHYSYIRAHTHTQTNVHATGWLERRLHGPAPERSKHVAAWATWQVS